jgi:vitamin B12 transporter
VFDGQEDKDGYNRRAISAVGNSQFTDEISGQLVGRYEKGGAEYDTKWAGSADENEYENYSAKLGSQYKSDAIYAEVNVATMKDQGGTFVSDDKANSLSEITTKRNQFGLLGQYMFSDDTSATAGFDWYKEKVSAGDLDSWTPGNQSWSKDSRTTKAFYVLGRHQMNSFLFEGAVRRDDIQGLDAETTYNLSVGYQLNADWLVSASRGTGFKAPTFNDLYWPGSGNPLLKPEKVESNEVLVRGQLENADIEVSVYDSKIEDLIAWAPDASGAWRPMNINQADIQGLEFTGNYYIGDWSHNLAATYVKTEDKSTGKELLRRPKVSANYTLGYQVGVLTANATLRYRGESMDAGDAKLCDQSPM